MHNLVLDIVPAVALLGVLAKGIEFLVSHVAELAFLVGNEARSGGGAAVAELRGKMGRGLGLDQSGVSG